MAERKLFNARNELFGLMLFCESPQMAAEMMAVCRNDDWFQLPWAKETYRRIKELYAQMSVKDGVVPFTSLLADDKLSEEAKDKLDKGRKRFLDEKIDKNAVIDSLERFRKFRRLNELVEKANDMLSDREVTNPDDIIQYLETGCTETKVSRTSIQDNIHSIGIDFSMKEVLEDVFGDDKRTFIPTGVKEFDDRNGGINMGSTFLIAGNTGGGKTLTAMSVAEHMALHGRVAYIPLEMTATEMVQRQMAKHGRVEVNRISSKQWTEEEQDRCLEGYKAFHRKVKKQGNIFSIFKPDTDMSIQELFNALHPYDYDVICIDYISLLAGVDGEDAWRKLNEASRAAKVYASTHNKIVILLAQLNNEGGLRYSQGLLDHFNNAWFFVANEQTKENGCVTVSQPKARMADPSPFELEIEYQYMSIGESSSVKVDVADPKDVRRKRRLKDDEPAKPTREERRKRRLKDDEETDDEPKAKRQARSQEDERSSKRPPKPERTREDDDEEDSGIARKRKPPVRGRGSNGRPVKRRAVQL